ncbi:GNAT family N-acetyltransferase [Sinobaca sp. H24]|uniref:GNAT family N-acetyltransferase n=1 Tax=Sinobaca sp. H24 TaxID=2923376 RepID=UPI002079AA4A|nr:GNAT family protein [Sinobaca sp. H24]
MIGTIDFAWWERGNGTVEIGFAIAEQYWGRGLIYEAACALNQFAFERMGVTRIEARCFAENTQSIRVLEKMGMTYEGTLRQRLLVKGERRNVHIYSILYQEWKQQNLFP